MIKSGFNIIGISIRTTNQNEQAKTDLGKLWDIFFTENIMEKIPHKVTHEIYAIYTDYEHDYTGEYTCIIGIPVASLEIIPEGLTGRAFEAENFQSFLAKGQMPQAVVETWMDIWRRDEELNRKYNYDYEVYGVKSQNGEHAEVEIFLSVM